MESRQKVLELIRRFEDLPEGNESILRSLLVDLKFFIQENFGSDSQYLGYLRYVKFRPEAVFITDKERERSWHDGIAQVDNLLRVILNDTKITPAPAQSSIITPVEETSQECGKAGRGSLRGVKNGEEEAAISRRRRSGS